MAQSVVKVHYNQREQQTRSERTKSSIYTLRCINNWVKSVLIHDHVASDANVDVLDICSGRGGDLNKWSRHRARSITMVDLAQEEVNRARERWQNQQEVSPSRTTVEFICADAFAPLPKLQDSSFDVVSCQFALHYAFGKSEAVQSLFENVSRALKPGGVFICTFPDAERIKNYCFRPSAVVEDTKQPKDNRKDNIRVSEDGNVNNQHIKPDTGCGTYRNSICEIAFDEKENDIAAGRLPVFSSMYRFSLGDAIRDCPEYLVSDKVLLEEAKIAGLRLVRTQTFDDLCHDAVEKNQHHATLWRTMVQTEPSVDEWDVICLYRACVFVRDNDSAGYSGERRRQVSYQDCWHTLPGFENSRYVFSGEEKPSSLKDDTDKQHIEIEQQVGEKNAHQNTKSDKVLDESNKKTANIISKKRKSTSIDSGLVKKSKNNDLTTTSIAKTNEKNKEIETVEKSAQTTKNTVKTAKSNVTVQKIILRKPAGVIVYRDGSVVKKGTRAKAGDCFECNNHTYIKADGSGWTIKQ